MSNKRKNRSDKYQPLFAELSFSNEMMADFADSQGLMVDSQYNDELLELKEQLRNEFWRLVDTKLTDRQKEVIHLYAEGFTQTEIAKKLNVNQSSITKSINGNCDYRNGKRVYGGANKKLRRLAEEDNKIQEILFRIAELEGE